MRKLRFLEKQNWPKSLSFWNCLNWNCTELTKHLNSVFFSSISRLTKCFFNSNHQFKILKLRSTTETNTQFKSSNKPHKFPNYSKNKDKLEKSTQVSHESFQISYSKSLFKHGIQQIKLQLPHTSTFFASTNFKNLKWKKEQNKLGTKELQILFWWPKANREISCYTLVEAIASQLPHSLSLLYL